MCTTCGCGADEVRIEGGAPLLHRHADRTEHAHLHDGPHTHDATFHEHDHAHDRAPRHAHACGLDATRRVQVERDILSKNDEYARSNRALFADRGIFAVNLVSSPGSGKTSLLVKTIEALRERLVVSVIEGDQQTSVDAERIRATGAPAIQVNTGKGCHLDAHMVGHAAERLALARPGVLMIENVGNLVCPSAFDLGEAHKVVVLSVTEGEDKPLKYPSMFAAADLMLLNKSDLLPHLDFDVGVCIANALRVNPHLQTLVVSARTGEGMAALYAWIESRVARLAAARSKAAAAPVAASSAAE